VISERHHGTGVLILFAEAYMSDQPVFAGIESVFCGALSV
jgi:hypothetical protein